VSVESEMEVAGGGSPEDDDVVMMLPLLPPLILEGSGELMKPGVVYGGYKSNLMFLFKRYRYIPREGYSVELKEYMDGVKRIANEARVAGEVSAYC